MIIELPKKFSYANTKNGRKCAKVKNGILYIDLGVNFEKLMYSLTYSIKGNRRCCYCRQKVSKEKITIDHMYPKDYGGISITNNLQPSCTKCNNDKANLNYNQYMTYKLLPKYDKKEFYRCIIQKKEQIRAEIGYDLPEEWVVMKNVSDLKTIYNASDLKAIYIERPKGKNYHKVEEQYEKYGTFRKPITTDRNLYILDGYNIYRYATENNIEMVPVNVLENVEVVY